MAEQVIAVLMQFIDGNSLLILDLTSMSIRDCLDLATKVNSSPEPLMVMCTPDLTNIPIDH